MWADQPWRPLEPDSDWISLLGKAGVDLGSLSGAWQIRGGVPGPAPTHDTLVFSEDSIAQLNGQLHTAQQPIAVDLGGTVIRYVPPGRRKPMTGWRRYWAIAVGIFVKLKLVLVFLSVLASLVVYGLAFGWAYGAGLVALIAIHELGHVVANRIKGIPASLPLFIPFLGAFIQLKQYPKSAADEAFIGIMGPLFGLGASLVAAALALVTRQPFFWAVAEMGFLLHVFNLMPVLPLDGGRTVGFWQWKAWIPGMIGVLVVLFYNPLTNQFRFDPLTVLILAIILFSLIREPRMRTAGYTTMPPRSRILYSGLWAGALLVSIVGYWGFGRFGPL